MPAREARRPEKNTPETPPPANKIRAVNTQGGEDSGGSARPPPAHLFLGRWGLRGLRGGLSGEVVPEKRYI